MPDKTSLGTSSGAPISAGPEQHLHVDHGSATLSGGTPAKGALRDTATSALDRTRAGAADGVETARRWAEQRYDAALARTGAAVDQGRRYVSDLGDQGGARLAHHRSRLETFVAENPALVGVVGVAAGLLLGAILPRTAREDEAVGPYAAEARDQGLRFAREAMQSGRAYVGAALDQANDAMGQATAAVRPETAGTGERTGPSGRYQNH